MKKVLVVDDEKLIVKGIKFSLEQDEMQVTAAYNGEDALELAKNNEYDIILLDVMLPGLSGFDVCQAIREFSDVPIIMLTAKGDDMDKILGLEYGADDYICKPFGVKELQARVAAHLRRENRERHHKLSLGDFQFDLSAQELYLENQLLDLTKSEYGICQFLAENKGQVFSKEQIYTHLYGYEDKGSPTAVAEHIKNIRAKLKNVGQNPIETVWGIGYKWH